MDFYLQPAFLCPPPPLEITENEYFILKDSRIILSAALSFEENYDLLIGNYLELESSALTIAAASMARRTHEYQDFFELTAEMNRRAINFLSTARLFVDQLRQRIGECGGDKAEVKRRLGVEYDAAFEYRFMEALRNHVQHSGSAVHGLSVGGDWDYKRTPPKKVFALGLKTQKRFLLLDSSFKKTILEECPDEVDFMGASRHYLSALSKVHGFARNNIEGKINSARFSFEEAIDRYKNFSGAGALGLAAFSRQDKNTANPVNIMLNWDDVRLKLVSRNRSLEKLGENVISSCAH